MAYTLKQLVMAYTAVHDGAAPDAETLSTLTLMTDPSFSDSQVMSYILNSADGSTALAVLSYQFFTGKSPTAAGLDYLLNSATNTTDLNDAYYAKFNTGNRYINFAANLGANGEGATAFSAKYGAMSFTDYVASIYETIVGKSYAEAGGIDAAKAIASIVSRQAAILATAESAGMITPGMSQAQIDLALKAATAGYLLGEAIKADVGIYAGAANNFMLALAAGHATYNTDLTSTYAATAGGSSHGTGNAVDTAPPILPGADTPPPPPEPDPEPDPAVSHAFTLTTGGDTFTGESLDDTFTATVTLTGSTLAPASTYDPVQDVLNGAGGNDTLALTIGGSGAPHLTIDASKISNIERLRLTATVLNTTVTLTTTSSFSEVVNDGSSATGLIVTGFGTNVTKLGISNLTGGKTVTFKADNTALTGGADAVTLTITNIGGSTTPSLVTITTISPAANAYETLNIVSNGAANYVNLATGANQTSLAKITISGAAPLTLGLVASDNARLATTFDASATTGGVTIGGNLPTTSLGAADQTVKLGSGDDVVFFGANLTSADTVDGGAGYDVLGVNSAVTDGAVLTNVSNVEAIRFNPTTTTITQDASLLTGHGINELQFEKTTLTSVNLHNVWNGAKISLIGAMNSTLFTLSTTLANDTVSDSLTVNLIPTSAANTAIAILNDVAGLETLNIVSNSIGLGGAFVITSDRVAARQVITGARDLTMTGFIVTPMNVDAGAFTGKLTISAQTGSTQNDTVVLGTGADVVTMGSGTNTIYIGPTTDTSHAYRGADVITRGGADIIVFTDNTETVGGGGSASSAGVVSVANGGSTVTLQFSAGDDHFSIANAASVSAHGLSKGAVAQGLSAGDAMVNQTVAQNDAAAAAVTDASAFQLSTSTPFATDIKTTFANALGTASITGLAADGAYLVSLYDSTHHAMLLAIVNTGASAAGDTTLSAADFTDTGIVLIGSFAMPSAVFNLGAAI